MTLREWARENGEPESGVRFVLKHDVTGEQATLIVGDMDSGGTTTGCGCCADSWGNCEVLSVDVPAEWRPWEIARVTAAAHVLMGRGDGNG